MFLKNDTYTLLGASLHYVGEKSFKKPYNILSSLDTRVFCERQDDFLILDIFQKTKMSILENSDEIFFSRTEKSGYQILLDRHTENGKNICICFYDFFCIF